MDVINSRGETKDPKIALKMDIAEWRQQDYLEERVLRHLVLVLAPIGMLAELRCSARRPRRLRLAAALPSGSRLTSIHLRAVLEALRGIVCSRRWLGCFLGCRGWESALSQACWDAATHTTWIPECVAALRTVCAG